MPSNRIESFDFIAFQPLDAVQLHGLDVLPVHRVFDDVDALEKGEPLGDQVGKVDQTRSVSRVAAEYNDLEEIKQFIKCECF